MPYIEVPIIGSGDSRNDPYRAGINVSKSCVIPTDKDGKPTSTTTIVWVPDRYETEIPRSITRINTTEARELIRQLDPNVNPDRVEQKPRTSPASGKR
jgi:hypothetical protein